MEQDQDWEEEGMRTATEGRFWNWIAGRRDRKERRKDDRARGLAGMPPRTDDEWRWLVAAREGNPSAVAAEERARLARADRIAGVARGGILAGPGTTPVDRERLAAQMRATTDPVEEHRLANELIDARWPSLGEPLEEQHEERRQSGLAALRASSDRIERREALAADIIHLEAAAASIRERREISDDQRKAVDRQFGQRKVTFAIPIGEVTARQFVDRANELRAELGMARREQRMGGGQVTARYERIDTPPGTSADIFTERRHHVGDQGHEAGWYCYHEPTMTYWRDRDQTDKNPVITAATCSTPRCVLETGHDGEHRNESRDVVVDDVRPDLGMAVDGGGSRCEASRGRGAGGADEPMFPEPELDPNLTEGISKGIRRGGGKRRWRVLAAPGPSGRQQVVGELTLDAEFDEFDVAITPLQSVTLRDRESLEVREHKISDWVITPRTTLDTRPYEPGTAKKVGERR